MRAAIRLKSLECEKGCESYVVVLEKSVRAFRFSFDSPPHLSLGIGSRIVSGATTKLYLLDELLPDFKSMPDQPPAVPRCLCLARTHAAPHLNTRAALICNKGNYIGICLRIRASTGRATTPCCECFRMG